jgi:hypothetical protein
MTWRVFYSYSHKDSELRAQLGTYLAPLRHKGKLSDWYDRQITPGANPYDGHTLGPVIADLEKLTGVAARRFHGDKGYRGHNYPDRFKVWISGQVRRVTKTIRREMRRRSAVEPVIGHLKDDHRMRRNHLKGRHGDRINARARRCRLQFQPVAALVQGTFARPVMDALSPPLATTPCVEWCSETFFTDDSFSLVLGNIFSKDRKDALRIVYCKFFTNYELQHLYFRSNVFDRWISIKSLPVRNVCCLQIT